MNIFIPTIQCFFVGSHDSENKEMLTSSHSIATGLGVETQPVQVKKASFFSDLEDEQGMYEI